MDSASIVILRLLVLGVFILLSYGIIKLISQATKGKVVADSFAAINGFLYFGLIVNLIIVISEPFPSWITLLVITGILIFRKRSSGRWI